MSPVSPNESILSSAHSAVLATVPAPAQSRLQGETVAYQADGVTCEGFLARDVSLEGRRPAVLILHDWLGVGDTVVMRAQMLARLGYVAFAADLYGADVRPDPATAPGIVAQYYADLALLRSRVASAFQVLSAHPAVDPQRIVVIGYCFGGSAALEFARTGAPVCGTVSFHGRLITHEPSDAGNITLPLVIFTGGSDPSVPDSAVAAFQEELRTAPHVDWQVTTYANAPHAFTVPGSDHYRPTADARSWKAFCDFLGEVVA